mmetsp:Transcript_10445/g.11919  ORF Transcript_10445/g.11919 Transcript_10445/m.11919 type:complete len:714 (-) Transcript_10445:22-2163(-)
MANKEVVKDCRSAVQFEQELQISYAQRGVAIVDIYSAEWGSCRAISETFRRLATEQGDGVHLRFLAAECHSILASLKQPEEQRNPQRPKNIENIRDTLPEGWQSILEERKGQSKPYFLFYKEGKKCGFVEGVNTPQIRLMVKDLCTVKTPASEFISNPRLQEFWDENFNPEESEIPVEKFFKGLQAACKYTVSFQDTEKQALLDAVGVPKDAKEKLVTADLLQKWFGDDDVKTIQVLVVEIIPEYESRAAAVQQREAEEKKALEEQRVKEAKEQADKIAAEKAAAEAERKKAEEEAAAAAASASATKASHQHHSAEDDVPTEDLLQRVPELKSASDCKETSAHLELRNAIKSTELQTPPVSTTITLVNSEEASLKATEILSNVAGVKTLTSLLMEHMQQDIVAVNAARAEVDKKMHQHIPSVAKLAQLLVVADGAIREQLLPGVAGVDLASLAQFSEPSVAMTLSATAAVAAPAVLYFSGDRGNVVGLDAVAVGGTFTLPPFTVLSSAMPADPAAFSIVLRDVPHGISLAELIVATHWFAQFTVDSVSDGSIEATFACYTCQEEFDTAAANFSTASNEDTKKFAAIEALQKREVEAEHQQATAPEPEVTSAPEAADAPATEAADAPAPEAADASAPEAADASAPEAADAPAPEETQAVVADEKVAADEDAAEQKGAAAASEADAVEQEVKEAEAEKKEKEEETKPAADPNEEL